MLGRRPILTLVLTAVFALTLAVGFVVLAHGASAQLSIDTNLGSTFNLGTSDLQQTIINIVQYVLGLLGLIAVIIIMYGGFLWLTARGNAQQVEKAKRVLRNAVIGLIIVLLAWAIVIFVTNTVLNATGNNTNSNPCPTPPCTPPILPGDQFTLRQVETATASSPLDYSANVYRCSKLTGKFNHDVGAQSVIDSVANAANPLVVQKAAGGAVAGTFTPLSNTLTFSHPALFDANTDYQLLVPKTVLDTNNQSLRLCTTATATPSSMCTDAGNHFVWPFRVGSLTDTVPPTVTTSYPVNSGSGYPDRNVNRQPILNISFSEPVDMTTVQDASNHPFTPAGDPDPNIFVDEFSGDPGSGGTVVAGGRVPNGQWNVSANPNGTDISVALAAPNSLKAFTWYRITVKKIEDLCTNAIAPPKVWFFETNDTVAGIGSTYPTGANQCPGTEVMWTFTTSMYFNDVSFTLRQGATTVGSGDMPPASRGGATTRAVAGGTFEIVDVGNPSTDFRIYRFRPSSSLATNQNFTVTVATDRVIDSSGGTLGTNWTFSTTTPDRCACKPYIASFSPDQGGPGQCVSLIGACFTGTTDHPGTITGLQYGKDPNFTAPQAGTIGGVSAGAITSTIPPPPAPGYTNGDFVRAKATLTYTDPAFGTSVSDPSASYFFVNSASGASGPCLLSLEPNSGYSGSSVSAVGERFNPASAVKNLRFARVGGGTTNAATTLWSDPRINGTVPANATSGFVTVQNDAGISNPLTYTVLIPPPGIPVVTSTWPNCDAACVNAAAGATFSLDMDLTTISPVTVSLKRCTDSTCSAFVSTVTVATAYNAAAKRLDITPSANLAVDAWYRGILKGLRGSAATGGGALGGLNYDDTGGASPNSFAWTFKTKNDPSLCALASIDVVPASTTLSVQNQTVGLTATPLGSPDSCNAGGQALNPSAYSWGWSSSNALAVPITSSSNTATATAAAETTAPPGYATVTAAASGKSGSGTVRVDFSFCDDTTDCTRGGACGASSCNNALSRCSPVITGFSPTDGAPRTFVTVNGCYFGGYDPSVSKVTFTDNVPALVPDPATCGSPGNLWSDSQILTEVPTGAATGPLTVTRSDAVVSPASGTPFTVNGTARPGLCRIDPTSGSETTSVTLYGTNFGATRNGPADGVTFWNAIQATSFGSWSDSQLQTAVPIGATNTVSGDALFPNEVFVHKAAVNSNPLNFDVRSASCTACVVNQPGQCSVVAQSCGNDGCCAVRPTVATVTPSAGATGICRNAAVFATFSTPLDPSSVTPENVVLLKTQIVGGIAPISINSSGIQYSAGPPPSCDFSGSDASGTYIGACANRNFATANTLTFSGAPLVLGLTTKNVNGNLTPAKYDIHHSVDVYDDLDNSGTVTAADLKLGTVLNPAVPDAYTGYLAVTPPPGTHKVLLAWTNDWTDPVGGISLGDSNIAIYNVTVYPEGKLTSLTPQLTSGTQIDLVLTTPLDANSLYLGRLRGSQVRYGLRGTAGAPLLDAGSDGSPTDRVWTFTTQDGPDMCVLDHVDIYNNILVNGGNVFMPPTRTQIGPTGIFGSARDRSGQTLFPTASFSWTWSWASSVPARATVTNSNNPAQMVTLLNNPGSVDISATATASAGWTGSVTGKATFTIVVCDAPWFFRDSPNYPAGSQDQNFSSYYCAGTGASALPLFTYSGAATSTCEFPAGATHSCGIVAGSKPDPEPVKEYFFKESSTSRDAIGIRVYRNSKKLSPLGWYRDRFGSVKSPAATTLGGYPAVQDGATYYVAVANLDGSTLYDYIYVLSYNADASASTVAIWQQFVTNLSFTLSVPAQLDRQDLAHDIEAIGALGEVATALAAKGKPYPTLAAGSYLTGFSTSAWPSWNQTLGTALGTSLPTASGQGFPNCTGAGYERSTCWRQSTRDFRCVTTPDPTQNHDDSVLAYRVSGGSANLYTNLRYAGTGSWRNFSGNACSGIGAGSNTACSCFNYNLSVP